MQLRRVTVYREPSTGRYQGDDKGERWVNTVTEARKYKGYDAPIKQFFVMPDIATSYVFTPEMPSPNDCIERIYVNAVRWYWI